MKAKKEKYLLWFEKPPVTLLFDYKRWTRPLRYKKNNRFKNVVQNDISHFFFMHVEVMEKKGSLLHIQLVCQLFWT